MMITVKMKFNNCGDFFKYVFVKTNESKGILMATIKWRASLPPEIMNKTFSRHLGLNLN